MKRPSIRLQMAALLALLLAVVWLAALYDVDRDKDGRLREAEVSTVLQAQSFAENSRSTIKRIDETLLDLRARWLLDPAGFAELVRHHQESIADIVFQVGVIDADGYLVYSNLPNFSARVNLGDREHFRVHKQGEGDRLFISKPVVGKVSRQWAIQFTRPIRDGDRFAGVLVISVSPATFAGFHDKLRLGASGVTNMVSSEGEIMARFPDDGSPLGRKLSGTPYLLPDAPLAGHFRRVAQVDGVERIYGYYRLADFGLNFVVGHALGDVLAPNAAHRQYVFGLALVINGIVLILVYFLYRSLAARNREMEIRARLAAIVDASSDAIVGSNLDGLIMAWNGGAERMFGYRAAEAIGQPVTILHPPALREDGRAMIARVQGGETISQFETRRRHRDGREIDVALNAFPVRSAQGAMVGTAAIYNDISARKGIEASRERQLRGIRALNEIAAVAELPLAEELRRALRIGAEQLGLEYGIVSRIEGDAYTIVAQVSPPGTLADGQAFALGTTYCALTLERDDVLAIADMAHSPYLGHPCYQACRLETYVGTPIRLHGHLFGTVNFSSPSPYGRAFDDGDTEFMALLGRWVGAAIERHFARQDLAESEERHRLLFTASKAPMLIIDPADGAIVDANLAAQAFHGYDRDQLTAMRISAINQLSAAELQAEMARAREEQRDCFYFPHRLANGEIRQVEVRSGPIDLGGRRLLYSIIHDVTERKRLEALLAAEFTRNRLFLRTASDGIHILTEAGNVVEASDSFCAMLGYPRDEVIGMNASQWEAGLSGEELRRTMAGVLSAGRTTFETLHRRKDGTLLAVEIHADGFELDGQRYLFCSSRDISQRQRDQAALRDSEARYRLVVDSVSEVIFQTDAAGRWRLLNPAWEGVTGFAPAEALGRPYLEFVYPDDAAQSAELFHDLVAGRNDECRCRLRFLHKAGGFRWIEVFARPTPGEDGAILGAAGTLADITDRLLAEEQQRQAASVFSHAHDGILICDADERILDVNPAFTQLTGYGHDEVIGHTPRIMQSRRQTPGFYAQMWQALRDQGHWEGEIANRRKNGEVFAEWLSISAIVDAHGAVTRYIGVFSDITAIKSQQEKLELLAHFDALTQLPNRVLLADRLEQAIAQARRAGTLLAVCYLDMDGFKPVNDQFGHEAGDHVLIEVARRLKDTMRGSDTVARLGGDEFVVLVSEIDSAMECQRAIARILAAVAPPIQVKGQSIALTASVGVTLYPQDGGDPDTLLRHADQAMYAAKQAGRNRYHMFDPEHDERARAHREGLEEIRSGLAAGQFHLVYQPKVDMRRGQVLGFEALIRWQHPQRGLLPPAQFLPQIENTEVDLDLGRWVIGEGLRQLDEWRGLGLGHSLSVNISAAHLLMPGFADELAAHLARHPRLERHAVELEILETVALEDLEQASAVFNRCRELGVQIALDDFGTGYSSLSYFRRLPVDTLKIDQSFVRSMLDNAEDLAIVQSVIGLTQAFRRNLVAEGIETAELGALLIQMGCDVGQGYGIARPMPAAEVPDWLRRFRPNPTWSVGGVGWAAEDLPLLTAEIEHVQWVAQLDRWLNAESRESAEIRLPVLDGRACRFGRWLGGDGRVRYGQCDAFASVGELHAQAHRLANELVTLHNDGGPIEARRRVAELAVLRDQLVERLHVLQAEIHFPPPRA